jgi:hypothetical protein
MRARKMVLYLLLAYGMAWTLEFGFFALGGRVNSGAFTAIALLCMFVPATAALITQKLIWKAPLRDLGLSAPHLPWLAVAWLLPHSCWQTAASGCTSDGQATWPNETCGFSNFSPCKPHQSDFQLLYDPQLISLSGCSDRPALAFQTFRSFDLGPFAIAL